MEAQLQESGLPTTIFIGTIAKCSARRVVADGRERDSGGSEVINRVIAILSGAALLGAIFATPNVTRAGSPTWYVGPNTHVSGGSCEDPDFSPDGVNDQDEVQAAVDAATAGDTIILCEGTFFFEEQVSIGIDLTFIGAGEEDTVIDGQDTTRLFNSTANLTLESMTLQDANSTDMNDCIDNYEDGGAVCVDGTASLRSTRFLNNYSDDWGGAVAAGEVRIARSVFTGNVAKNNGGAVATESLSGAESAIDMSVFSDNIAAEDDGGAVWTSERDMLTISRSQFTGNQADDDGGAVVAFDLNVARSRGNLFRANVAGDLGGALYVHSNRRSDAAKLKRANRFYRNQSAKRSASDVFVDRSSGGGGEG
jgi:predicted outer membrane repeat protein